MTKPLTLSILIVFKKTIFLEFFWPALVKRNYWQTAEKHGL